MFGNISVKINLLVLSYHKYQPFSTNVNSKSCDVEDYFDLSSIIKISFGFFLREKTRKIYLINQHLHLHISNSLFPEETRNVLKKNWIPLDLIKEVTYFGGLSNQFSATKDRFCSKFLLRILKRSRVKILGFECNRIINQITLKKWSNYESRNTVEIVCWPRFISLNVGLKLLPNLKKTYNYQINDKDESLSEIGSHKNLKELTIINCHEKIFSNIFRNKSIRDIYVDYIIQNDFTKSFLFDHPLIEKISTNFLNLMSCKSKGNNNLKELNLWFTENDENKVSKFKEFQYISKCCKLVKLVLTRCNLIDDEENSLLFQYHLNLKLFEINEDENTNVSIHSFKNYQVDHLILNFNFECDMIIKSFSRFVSSKYNNVKVLNISKKVLWNDQLLRCFQKNEKISKICLLYDKYALLFLMSKCLNVLVITCKYDSFLIKSKIWDRKVNEVNENFFDPPDFSRINVLSKNALEIQKREMINKTIVIVMYKKCKRLYKKKKFLKGFKLLNECIESSNFPFVDLYIMRSNFCLKLKYFRKCVSDCSDILEKNCENVLARKNIIKGYMGLKKYKQVVYHVNISGLLKKESMQWLRMEKMICHIECKKCKVIRFDLKFCTACKKVFYCSRDCQVLDWDSHKYYCRNLKHL